MTLELVNHFLFGSMRAVGLSRLWKDAAFVTLPAALCWALPSLNMFKVLTFFAELHHKMLAIFVGKVKKRKEEKNRDDNIPIEVFTLDLDIGHAITRLPLPLLPRCFFFTGTHVDG
jgi:hypothetical protein